METVDTNYSIFGRGDLVIVEVLELNRIFHKNVFFDAVRYAASSFLLSW